MARVIRKKILHTVAWFGFLLFTIVPGWSQSSDPSLPFPVFKIGYDEPDSAEGNQVGFANLIDHRGIFLSVGHVFWANEDQEGNSDRFYVKYRDKKLWLHQLLSEEIKGQDKFPNDGIILLYASLSMDVGTNKKVKFSNFRESFPHYNKFSISELLDNGQSIPEIKINDNGSVSNFTAFIPTSLQSTEITIDSEKWCSTVYSIGVDGISKGRSGSPVLDRDGNISGIVSAKNIKNQDSKAIIIPSECILKALANSYYGELRLPLASLWEDWRVDEITQRSTYQEYFSYYLGRSEISIFDWLQLVSKYQDTYENVGSTNVEEAINKLFPVTPTENETSNINKLRSSMHDIMKEKNRAGFNERVLNRSSDCENIGLRPMKDIFSLQTNENFNILLRFDLSKDCNSYSHQFLDFSADMSLRDISGWVNLQKNYFPAEERPRRHEIVAYQKNEQYSDLTIIEERLLVSVAASYNAALLAKISFEKYGSDAIYRMGRMVDFLDWTVRLLEFYVDSSFPNNNSGINREVFCRFVSKFTTQLKYEIDNGVEMGINYPSYMIGNINYSVNSCLEG